MANENSEQTGRLPVQGGNAPGLAGVYGRLRLVVAGKPVGTLVVEGTYVAVIPDISGPADTTVMFVDEAAMRKLVNGELNPFIASMRRQARLAGNRALGTRVMMGLQVGSPFADDANKGGQS